MSTSAKAYGMIRRKLAGMEIAKQDVNRVPLWNSSYCTTKIGTPYVSPKLLRKGITTVGDIRRGRAVDEERLLDIAPTWRPLYRQKVDWILAQEEMAQGTICLPGPSMPERWKLKDIQEAWAASEGVEDRQSDLL